MKENGRGSGEKIRYIWILKGPPDFYFVNTNFLCLYQKLSFYEMKSFDRALWHTDLMVDVSKCPGPEVIKLFSCSTQLSMKFTPLIHVKMPTIVGILTCMSGENSILGLSEPKKC